MMKTPDQRFLLIARSHSPSPAADDASCHPLELLAHTDNTIPLWTPQSPPKLANETKTSLLTDAFFRYHGR